MSRALVEFQPVLLGPDDTIVMAMESMNRSKIGIVLIVDTERRLQGVAVDGDIRRALLKRPDLEQPLTNVMTREPRVATHDISEEDLMGLASEAKSPWLPLVDRDGVVRGLVDLLTYRQEHSRLPNAAVLMAGGRGSRLMPHTDDTPKPMMLIGGRPILETALRVLHGHGIERFYISVNYLADQIEAHFGDGSRFGVELRYLREEEPLGTAGSIRPVGERETLPVLVMNGDVLSHVNARMMLEFHREEQAAATVAVRDHVVKVPYGVVETDGRHFVAVNEKPHQSVLINAGMYVIEPSFLDLIPEGERFDMTQLLTRINEQPGARVACFAVPEYWVDIGRYDDLEQARREFPEKF